MCFHSFDPLPKSKKKLKPTDTKEEYTLTTRSGVTEELSGFAHASIHIPEELRKMCCHIKLTAVRFQQGCDVTFLRNPLSCVDRFFCCSDMVVLKTSPQAKRHQPSLLITSLVISTSLTFITSKLSSQENFHH